MVLYLSLQIALQNITSLKEGLDEQNDNLSNLHTVNQILEIKFEFPCESE